MVSGVSTYFYTNMLYVSSTDPDFVLKNNIFGGTTLVKYTGNATDIAIPSNLNVKTIDKNAFSSDIECYNYKIQDIITKKEYLSNYSEGENLKRAMANGSVDLYIKISCDTLEELDITSLPIYTIEADFPNLIKITEQSDSYSAHSYLVFLNAPKLNEIGKNGLATTW